jgi:hypothetical protein
MCSRRRLAGARFNGILVVSLLGTVGTLPSLKGPLGGAEAVSWSAISRAIGEARVLRDHGDLQSPGPAPDGSNPVGEQIRGVCPISAPLLPSKGPEVSVVTPSTFLRGPATAGGRRLTMRPAGVKVSSTRTVVLFPGPAILIGATGAFDSSRTACLSTQRLALMASSLPGNHSLEIRWQGFLIGPDGRKTVCPRSMIV